MPTIDEEFNAEYFQKGLQPSVGSVQPIRNVSKTFKNNAGSSMQATGLGTSMGGKSVQIAGKVASRAGTTTMRAGAALSRTGIGAVVGVPLMAAGAGVAATGKVAQVTGKSLDRTGKQMTVAGRELKRRNRVLSKTKDLPRTIKKARADLTGIAWASSIWFSFHLPLGLISLALFGLAHFVKDVVPDMMKETASVLTLGLSDTKFGEFIGDVAEGIAKTALDAADWIIEKISGVSVLEIGDPYSYFMATHMLVYFVGLGTLFLLGLIYLFNDTKCLWGKNSIAKIGTFLLALYMYSFPVLNIFPWFLAWALVVLKNPE